MRQVREERVAANECHGVLEYWSVGVLGLVELDLFLYKWYKDENENRPSSALNLQYSITPSLHQATDFQTAKAASGIKSMPGALN
jgi:hypothetical protein